MKTSSLSFATQLVESYRLSQISAHSLAAHIDRYISKIEPHTIKNMKDRQICVQLEQIAVILTEQINTEPDCGRNCRLQDAKEHLRRAWHAVDGSPCEFNDLIGEPDRTSEA